jgi:hypothetical protein
VPDDRDDVIETLIEIEGLDDDEAEERYDELYDELGREPTIEDVYDENDIYDNLDDWLDNYDDFGSYEEYAAGADYGSEE